MRMSSAQKTYIFIREYVVDVIYLSTKVRNSYISELIANVLRIWRIYSNQNVLSVSFFAFLSSYVIYLIFIYLSDNIQYKMQWYLTIYSFYSRNVAAILIKLDFLHIS